MWGEVIDFSSFNRYICANLSLLLCFAFPFAAQAIMKISDLLKVRFLLICLFLMIQMPLWQVIRDEYDGYASDYSEIA